MIALADAMLISTGLFVLGVPLALSLSLLVLLGGFVPYLGALVSGTVAALVTLVTNGVGAALVVVGIVVVVQNVEGNLLQPLVQGHQIRLHPAVILVVVSVGYFLFGAAGAVVAVPITAVLYRVGSYLRTTESEGTTPPGARADVPRVSGGATLSRLTSRPRLPGRYPAAARRLSSGPGPRRAAAGDVAAVERLVVRLGPVRPPARSPSWYVPPHAADIALV